MHPVFGEVIQILESDVPETEDYLFAAELCAVLPDACHVENAHRDRINSIFNNDLDSNVAVQCIAGKFDTHGTCKEAGTNIEYKNDKGEGDSDLYMQNIGYFVQHWGEHCCAHLQATEPFTSKSITNIRTSYTRYCMYGIFCLHRPCGENNRTGAFLNIKAPASLQTVIETPGKEIEAYDATGHSRFITSHCTYRY